MNVTPAVLLASALLLAGCGGGQGPQIVDNDPEPGVYKGTVDPLTQASAEERAKKLAERFNQVQNRQ